MLRKLVCYYILIQILLCSVKPQMAESSWPEDFMCFASVEQMEEYPYATISILRCSTINIYDEFKSRLEYWNKFRYSGSGITRLVFLNLTVHSIPKGLFEKSGKFQELELTHSGLVDITRNDFENADDLIHLKLSSNSLTELRDSTFLNAVSLQKLNLSNNFIEKVHKNSFKNLKSLTYLDLSYNNITALPDEVFKSLVSLQYLKLKDNRLTVIDDNLFTNNFYLESLDLSENALNILSQDALKHLNYLDEINLSSNNLINFSTIGLHISAVSIQNNHLTSLSLGQYVKFAYAGNNYLTDIVIEVNEKFEELSLKNNSIHNNKFITNLRNLKLLDLSFNQIQNINITTFSNMQKLQKLYLKSINLTTIDYGTFSHQSKLVVLDISYNRLSEIDFNMLSALENLQQLFIDGNNLTSIDLNDFELLFPHLKIISLADNYWNCKHLVQIIKKMQYNNVRILIDPIKLVKNNTNIRGIFCTNEQTPRTFNYQQKTTVSHLNTITNEDKSIELNKKVVEIQQNLILTQNENEDLKFKISQLSKNLDELAANKSLINLNDSQLIIGLLTNHRFARIREFDETVDTFLRNDKDAMNSEINYNAAEKHLLLSDSDISHSDIKFFKVILSLLLTSGIVFVLFKIFIFSVHKNRRNFFPFLQRSSTKITTDENSI